jgi:1,4-dihydroxy-6-naphthoate synthase
MHLSLAYSPCPNDTFAFHAMVNNLIDTEGLEFDVHLADIQSLNEYAEKGKYDICKLSYHAFYYLADRYSMLHCGSALGFDNGPVLVKRVGDDSIAAGDIPTDSIVAVPGKSTTASLLMRIAYPGVNCVKAMLFSEIADAVLRRDVSAGVLIHEGRFVYKERGLELVRDLGEYYRQITGCPVPLGGVAVRRNLPCAQKVERVLRRSILFAEANPEASSDYIAQNAQELSSDVQRKHIGTFVNDYTVDIGEMGEEAVKCLYDRFLELNPHIVRCNKLFI